MKFGIAVTPKAYPQSLAICVFTATNIKFGFSLDLAALSKVGLILMHGGQEGLQKSTIRPGVSLISF